MREKVIRVACFELSEPFGINIKGRKVLPRFDCVHGHDVNHSQENG